MCVETHPNSAKPFGKQFTVPQVPAKDSAKCNSASQRLHLCWACVNPKLSGWRLTCNSKGRPTFRSVNEATPTKLKPRNPDPNPCAHPTELQGSSHRNSSQHLDLSTALTPDNSLLLDSTGEQNIHWAEAAHNWRYSKEKKLIYSLILAPITRDYSSLDYRCASLLWEMHQKLLKNEELSQCDLQPKEPFTLFKVLALF